MENVFLKYEVFQEKYHGGELNGLGSEIMCCIKDIFHDIQEFLPYIVDPQRSFIMDCCKIFHDIPATMDMICSKWIEPGNLQDKDVSAL